MSAEASVRHRAERALTAALERGGGSRSIDADGRVARLEENMLDCMTVAQLREATAQVARGAGASSHPRTDIRRRCTPRSPRPHSAPTPASSPKRLSAFSP